MGWEKVGGDATFSIMAWVPDDDGQPPVGDSPVPPTEPFFGGEEKIECEFGLVSPCLERRPERARWMLQWGECNCDDDPPAAICVACFNMLMHNVDGGPYTTCGTCGLHFMPARALIRDVVELP